MSRLSISLASLAVLGFALGLGGCESQTKSPSPNPADEGTHEEAASDHEHGDHADHAEHEEALSKLAPADRALAEKQKVCPVSGGALGAMGKPYKVTVKGREVFLCCQGCEAAILKDPDKYLAKLPK